MENRIRILAVDDEPDLRQLLGIHLRARGYEVLEAADGYQAVELLRRERNIDLVIMDIMMPGISGVEACARIREFSAVPVLFLTAKSQITDKADAYDSGGESVDLKLGAKNRAEDKLLADRRQKRKGQHGVELFVSPVLARCKTQCKRNESNK